VTFIVLVALAALCLGVVPRYFGRRYPDRALVLQSFVNAVILAIAAAILVGVLIATGEPRGAVAGLIAVVGFGGIAVHIARNHLRGPRDDVPRDLDRSDS